MASTVGIVSATSDSDDVCDQAWKMLQGIRIMCFGSDSQIENYDYNSEDPMQITGGNQHFQKWLDYVSTRTSGRGVFITHHGRILLPLSAQLSLSPIPLVASQ